MQERGTGEGCRRGVQERETGEGYMRGVQERDAGEGLKGPRGTGKGCRSGGKGCRRGKGTERRSNRSGVHERGTGENMVQKTHAEFRRIQTQERVSDKAGHQGVTTECSRCAGTRLDSSRQRWVRGTQAEALGRAADGQTDLAGARPDRSGAVHRGQHALAALPGVHQTGRLGAAPVVHAGTRLADGQLVAARRGQVTVHADGAGLLHLPDRPTAGDSRPQQSRQSPT